MKNCINCNNSIDDNAKFCNVCGANQNVVNNDGFDMDKTVGVYNEAPAQQVAPPVQPQPEFIPPVQTQPYAAPQQTNTDFDPDATVGAYGNAPVLEQQPIPEYNQQYYPGQPQAYPQNYQQYQQPPMTPQNKKDGMPWWVILIIVVLGLGILGVGGWFVYDNYIADNDSSRSDKEDDKDKDDDKDKEEETQPEEDEDEDDITVNVSTEAPKLSYTKGAVNDGVYENNWANIEYDTDGWEQGSTSEYGTFESDMLDCGLYLKDDAKGVFVITFEKLPSVSKDMTDEEYLDIIVTGATAAYTDYEVSDVKSETLAGEKCVAQTISLSDGSVVQKICIRKLDDYMIMYMSTAYSEADAKSAVGAVKTLS